MITSNKCAHPYCASNGDVAYRFICPQHWRGLPPDLRQVVATAHNRRRQWGDSRLYAQAIRRVERYWHDQQHRS